MRELIVEARKRKGLTQEALARRCGVTGAQISRIERGSRTGSIDLVLKICGALCLDVAQVAAHLTKTKE